MRFNAIIHYLIILVSNSNVSPVQFFGVTVEVLITKTASAVKCSIYLQWQGGAGGHMDCIICSQEGKVSTCLSYEYLITTSGKLDKLQRENIQMLLNIRK